MTFWRRTGLGISLLMAAHLARAEVVFQDFFNQEPLGQGLVQLRQWSVVNDGGSVDVLHNGQHGNLPCRAQMGRCVDLDGSTGVAAHLVSVPITLAPGAYRLTYHLAGSHRGDPNSVEVRFNGKLLRTVQMDSGADYKRLSDLIEVDAAASASIEFTHLGGDHLGLLLDAVVLRSLNDSSVVGGVATRTELASVVCRNLSTGQSVAITSLPGQASWNCQAAGLALKPGDLIEEKIVGRVR